MTLSSILSSGTLWVVLVAGAAFAVGIHVSLTRWLAREAARRLEEQMEAPVEVAFVDRPVALRLLRHRPVRTRLFAREVPVNGVRIRCLEVHLDGVRRVRKNEPGFALRTSGGRFTATFDEDAFAELASLPSIVRGVRFEDARVRFELPGGASVTTAVEVDDGLVVLAPDGDGLGPLRLLRIAIPLEELPFGGRVEAVRSRPGRLVVSGSVGPYPPGGE